MLTFQEEINKINKIKVTLINLEKTLKENNISHNQIIYLTKNSWKEMHHLEKTQKELIRIKNSNYFAGYYFRN